MPAPGSLCRVCKEMRYTWQQQQSDPDYFHDTPVPVAENAAGSNVDDSAASIGDLAPRALQ